MEEMEENILDKLTMPHVSQIRFPLKLWKLLNVCDSGAISWSIDGNSFIINRRIFQTEFLSRKANTFKTQNISSLVRQLNLYGFQKVQRRPFAGISRKNWPDLLEYRHTYFRRGHPELVNLVQRRSKEEEEDRVASNNLSFYQTPEPHSHTQPLQNQDEIYTITRKEENSDMLGPFGLQPVTQRHAQCQSAPFQSMKLPLKRLSNISPRNTQTPSLQDQQSVFQFPVTVAENLPFKIVSTAQNLLLGHGRQENVSFINVDKQDSDFQTIAMVGGNKYGQGSNLKSINLPFRVQVLENGVHTLQAENLQGSGVHTLQAENLQGSGVHTLQTENLQGSGVHTLQTENLQGSGVHTLQAENLQGSGVHTLQTENLQGSGVHTLQTENLQGSGVHTLQAENLQGSGVHTLQAENLQGSGVHTLQAENLQGSGVHTLQTENLQGSGVHTLQTENLQGSGVHTLQAENLQGSGVHTLQAENLQGSGVHTLQAENLQGSGVHTLQTENLQGSGVHTLQAENLKGSGVNSNPQEGTLRGTDVYHGDRRMY